MRVMAGLCLWMTAVGAGAQTGATERVQATVQSVDVPAGERLVLTAEGRGEQVYQCERKGERAGWIFVAPEAKLYVSGRFVVNHGAGPIWRHEDGSSVRGEVVAQAKSPNEGAVPLLLLRAVSHEGNAKGLLAGVNFMQRLETSGGVAPEGECEVGVRVRVPYSAVYRFYVAAE